MTTWPAQGIEELVAGGLGQLLPHGKAQLLDRHLSKYPWSINHLDWGAMKNTARLEWGQSSDEEANAFMLRTTLAEYPRVAAFYGERHPVVTFESRWAFAHLDRVAAGAQQYFLFGCSEGVLVPDAFAELEPCSTIWGFMRAKVNGAPMLLEEQLHREIRCAIRKASASHREICGLLVDNGHLLEMVPLKNRTKAPGSFDLGWKRIKRCRKAAMRLGHRVVGTYHSHPVSEAVPGESDIRGAEDGELMLIISGPGQEAKLWRIRSGKASEVPFRTIVL
jgi:proteasome lid subunit RPN8/RPN11